MIRQLRLLAYLRWKYLWRAGGRTRRIGAALSVVFSALISLAILAFSILILDKLFSSSQTRTSWEIVHLAFAAIYLFWLYTGSFNELYDPARLTPFPISPRTIFLGSTLSSFLGISSIFGLALLAGFMVGVPGSLVQKIGRALLFILFLIHLQMVARLIRLTFLAVLTSRRWRDAAVLISSLIGGAGYVLYQLFPNQRQVLAKQILSFAEAEGPSRWLGWTPPVWLSWAHQLNGVRSIVGFAAFAVLTAFVYVAGGIAERRLAFSDPIFHYRPKRTANRARVPFLRGASAAIYRLIGPAAAGVARKEFAVFFRDPAVRHRILTSVFYILLPFAVLFFARDVENDLGKPYRPVELGGFFLIFAEMFFMTNLFGLEGSAVRNLLWFPASRRDIFLGKNLAYLAIFVPFNAAVLAVIAGASASLDRLPVALATHLSSLLIVMALGNVASVFFPFPFLSPGQRMTRREENGCLMSIARLALYALTFALMAPVVGVSLILGDRWALVASVVGLVYSVGLYLGGLKLSERALLRREEELGDYFRAA